MPRKKIDVEILKRDLTSCQEPRKDLWLSTGSSLLDLACTGKIGKGYKAGCYYNFVGASDSGKSFLTLAAFAEASIDRNFDAYRLIYDNPENSLTMDVERFFGQKMAQRLEEVYSPSVEGFYYHLDDCFSKKQPFVYVLDSMDSLESEEDSEKFQEKKKAFDRKRLTGKTQEVTGGYGTAKAKANSNGLRTLMDPLRESGSILIIVSQSRKNLGFGAQFNPDVQSGGTALKFYAHLQIWTSVKELIKKRVKGKERELGVRVKLAVKKNRLNGRKRSVHVPIYHSAGVGELDSLVEWLLEEKAWKGTEDALEAPEFDFQGGKEEMIQKIQEESKDQELRKLVQHKWDEIEGACVVPRRSKYE